MSGGRAPQPPSGHPPPRHAELPGGPTLDLEALATEICRRYCAEYPDEQARYGEAGAAWCVHDNQHLLNWAVLEVRGYGDMRADVAWLARLARDLDIAADVVSEPAPAGVAAALRRAAAHVRETPTFRPPG